MSVRMGARKTTGSLTLVPVLSLFSLYTEINGRYAAVVCVGVKSGGQKGRGGRQFGPAWLLTILMLLMRNKHVQKGRDFWRALASTSSSSQCASVVDLS